VDLASCGHDPSPMACKALYSVGDAIGTLTANNPVEARVVVKDRERDTQLAGLLLGAFRGGNFDDVG
jgi:hypothetical protein